MIGVILSWVVLAQPLYLSVNTAAFDFKLVASVICKTNINPLIIWSEYHEQRTKK